jgi:hypothetical protein
VVRLVFIQDNLNRCVCIQDPEETKLRSKLQRTRIHKRRIHKRTLCTSTYALASSEKLHTGGSIDYVDLKWLTMIYYILDCNVYSIYSIYCIYIYTLFFEYIIQILYKYDRRVFTEFLAVRAIAAWKGPISPRRSATSWAPQSCSWSSNVFPLRQSRWALDKFQPHPVPTENVSVCRMIGKMVPAVGKIQSIYWYYKKGMIPTEK